MKNTTSGRALKTIAVYEAAKGLAALLGMLGVLSLLHHDLHHLALEFIGHFGHDPTEHYPQILLTYADKLNATPVKTILLLGCAYVAVRMVEAYGLWRERPWGEWLGAASGALYLPFEARHWMHKPNLTSSLVLLFNLAMVVFLLYMRWSRPSEPKTKS